MSVSPRTTTESLISHVISTWRGGRSPDAQRVLSQHPDLQEHKSLVLDLAYEEYCLRSEAGEQIAASTFCDRFPTFRRSLRRLIDVHDQFEQNPDEYGLSFDEIEWPQPGEKLLDFELQEEIGRGSLARVYLATEPSLGGRKVVLKVSPHGCHEANTLGKLTHRNIVDVHWAPKSESTSLSVICMPYLGNATLHDVLDVGFAEAAPPTRSELILAAARRGVPVAGIPDEYVDADPLLQRSEYVDGVVHLMVQLADALSHAHGLGIYHHDLKPSNILLSPSGCPLLLDFNLSEDTEVGPTMFGGTLPYMPHEQLQRVMLGPAAESTPASASWDVYSLGAILYELLTGVLPFGEFPSGTPEQLAAEDLAESQQRGYVSARARNPAVSCRLDRLIENCLNLDPNARPRSAEELAEQLRAQLAPVEKVKRWLHRRRWLVGTASSLALLTVAVIAGVLLFRTPLEVRSYEAGMRAFQDRRYIQAVGHFNTAHHAAPELYQPLVARAQAHAARGEYEAACKDLEVVCTSHPTGLMFAWWAYCQQMCDKPSVATKKYLEAIECGFVDAVVFNNLGDIYYQKSALPRAIGYYDQAINLDSGCQTAYFNRALAYGKYAVNDAASRQSRGENALADISMAIEIGPPSAQLYLNAAQLHAKFGNDPRTPQIVTTLLKQAVDCGLNLMKVQKLQDLKPFLDELRQHRPTTQAQTTVSESRSNFLLAPPPCFPSLPNGKS